MRIDIAPIGTGVDDWPHLIAALKATAYRGQVHMLPGTWYCKSQQEIPNGAHLVGSAGVHIVSELDPNAPPGVWQNSPFYASGNRDIVVTALSADAPRGSRTITVASAAEIDVGARLLIQHSGHWTQREVIAVNGDVLTLDRRLRRSCTAGDAVSVCATSRDITIEGNGMLVTGTGGALVQITTGRDCYISGIRAAVSMTFGFVYDVACRDCVFERCQIDCQNATPSGFLLAFGGENLVVRDCGVYNAGPTLHSVGVYMESLDSCRIEGGHVEASAGAGIKVTATAADTEIGCQSCVIDGAAIIGNAGAGVLVTRGNAIEVSRCETSYNQSGVALNAPAVDCSVVGGVARGNSVVGVISSGARNRVTGHTVRDLDGYAYSAQGGSLSLSDCEIVDTSSAAGAQAHITASAGATVRVNGVRCTTGRSAQHFIRCLTGATIAVGGASRFTGTGANSFGVLVDDGSVRLSDLTLDCQIGVYLNGENAHARIGDNVDLSACATQTHVVAGHLEGA